MIKLEMTTNNHKHLSLTRRRKVLSADVLDIAIMVGLADQDNIPKTAFFMYMIFLHSIQQE